MDNDPVIEELANIEIPERLLALAGEGWLGEAVEGYLARNTTWGNVCAIALLARGAIVDTDPAVVDDRIAVPLRTARTWSPEQRRTVHDLAIARVVHVLEELHELIDNAVVEEVDEPALARIDRVCRAREELAAVNSLLVEAGSADRLTAALAMLDERGEDVAAGFPLLDADDVDDVVAAGATLTPDEWWTRHVETT